MNAKSFMRILGADFFAGVPDSQLKAFCDCLFEKYGLDPKHHVVAANEGCAVGLAAGYHLATSKIPVVYMQNSGLGNAVNPIASLLNREVYGIPIVFVVGWRGEPGVHDEPQHVFQGRITLDILRGLDIESFLVSSDTTENELETKMRNCDLLLQSGKSIAFVVRKGALSFAGDVRYANPWRMLREDAIACVIKAAGDDTVISTTGKSSRELFELREHTGKTHATDFLTVGSMGHASSIALEIAVQNSEKRIWCIDGDGAVLMHMGALAVIGASGARNFIHIVLDNGCHETVGGMPTVSSFIDLSRIARACGYVDAHYVDSEQELMNLLQVAVNNEGPIMIIARCAASSRSDLMRPTISPQKSKRAFMEKLSIG